MRIPRHRLRLTVVLLAAACHATAQPTPDLKPILDRLDRLEAENRQLREEVRELRDQIAVPAAKLEERVEITENRTAELAQTKVEASQRFPVRLTGMALVNTFYNSSQN